MRTVLVAVCSAMVGFGMAASPVLAKTAKECQAEWRAHRDIFEPKGISEHDYVEECSGFPTAAPETAAGANPAPATAAPAPVKPAHVAAPVAPPKPKKPEARAEVNGKLSQESNHSARNGNAQLNAVARPPPAPLSDGGSCMTRHSGTIIHSERCGF
jgi:hypothetical protein